MPDLNLVEEGELEESSAPAPEKVQRGGGGGGGMTGILVIVLVLVIVGGGGFFFYKKGIWPFKKKPTPVLTQMQEEPFPQEQAPAPAAAEPQAVPEQKPAVDTTDVALLETPSVGEASKSAKGLDRAVAAAPSGKAVDGEATDMAGNPLAKLSEMKGEFTVQVVAYHEKEKADNIVKNLEAAGYPAFVEVIPMKGGDWHTVRIGRYPSRQEAKKAVLSFASELQSNCFIDKVHTH